MKIPKNVKIGAHTYKVRYEKDFDRNHSALGQSRHAKTQIILDPDQSQSQLEETLIHEIMHVINYQVRFVGADAEEDSVVRVSGALMQVIKDNKSIFK